jgi:hypothetical protein
VIVASRRVLEGGISFDVAAIMAMVLGWRPRFPDKE